MKIDRNLNPLPLHRRWDAAGQGDIDLLFLLPQLLNLNGLVQVLADRVTICDLRQVGAARLQATALRARLQQHVQDHVRRTAIPVGFHRKMFFHFRNRVSTNIFCSQLILRLSWLGAPSVWFRVVT